ncbi:MAG: dihydroorotate dehydrogenase [Bacillota bacterium]|nr:dihydroorotate dehydrogenase [Bacillota bacterium]
MVKLQVDLGGIIMKNPVTTASGTYGFGQEYQHLVPVEKLGAVTVKGLTLEPRLGNKGVRICETPSGMLNCIGLQNPGISYFISTIMPWLQEQQAQVIVNISGNTIDEYRQMAEALSVVTGIDGLEVNISCPNVKAGGMAFGTDPEQTFKVISAVKENTQLPVLAKLSPNVTDIVAIAKAAEAAGATGLAMINTLLGMAIDINKKRPILGNIMGGLSGPAIKPVALRAIWQVSQQVSLPILGMGGILTWEDAIEFLLAGATAVAVGTGNFINPMATLEIISGIEKYCLHNNILDVNNLTGLAWKEMQK